jgi:hypothetical protein
MASSQPCNFSINTEPLDIYPAVGGVIRGGRIRNARPAAEEAAAAAAEFAPPPAREPDSFKAQMQRKALERFNRGANP